MRNNLIDLALFLGVLLCLLVIAYVLMRGETMGNHAMTLEYTDRDGYETWICHDCGRTVMVRWLPSFAWLIARSGDGSAIHTGMRAHSRGLGDGGREMVGTDSSPTQGSGLPTPISETPDADRLLRSLGL